MFIYFDLGNVLAFFERARAYRQLSALTGQTPEQMRQAMHESGISRRYERGEISSGQFCDEFRRQTGSHADDRAILRADADIFDINHAIIPLVAGLQDAGYRLGVLSNISPAHWDFVCGLGCWLLPGAFSVHALSYELKSLKPEQKIYQAAAELAGVAPREIFFCDDIPGHVAGAREAGFDAVQFTEARTLAGELRRRGLKFNY